MRFVDEKIADFSEKTGATVSVTSGLADDNYTMKIKQGSVEVMRKIRPGDVINPLNGLMFFRRLREDFYAGIAKRFVEYEDKIEQGTLIELPFPLGTEVWCLAPFNHIWPGIVKEFRIRDNAVFGAYMSDPTGGGSFHSMIDEIFLTCEEAEKALEKKRKGELK